MNEAPPAWAVTLIAETRAVARRLDALEARLAPAPVVVDDPDDDVAATEARLLRQAQQLGLTVSGDGRVGADTAAALLAVAPGTLANARGADRGPDWNRRPVGGSRVSYSLHDLAVWIVTGREEL